MSKSYEDINKKIVSGEAVVVTAEEIIEIVREKGLEETAELVDVVTTATYGPMCSTGAFLNFGHSSPAIRMQKTFLNDVEAYSGIAAVDAYIGATQCSEKKGISYGGAHVICDLIDGKEVELKATSTGTDCYPRKEVLAKLKLEDLNEAYLYNPRNVYQNYNAAINMSEKEINTYMGTLNANGGNINFSTSGQLSPLLNDPLYRTIGMGTRIFIGGAIGYVSHEGTQFNSGVARGENDVPLTPAGTLAVTGNLKDMSTEYMKPVSFKGYGVSMFMGIGIPIPVLDVDMLKHLAIEDKDIYTNVIDYSVSDGAKPILAKVNYEQLKSGQIEIQGKKVRTKSLTSMKKSRDIANKLKFLIEKGEFLLQEPIRVFDTNNKVKSLKHE